MSAIASSSRPLVLARSSLAGPSSSSSCSRRTVIHHARPPRVPILHSPHHPKQPLPTSGTSHPNANKTSTSASASAPARSSSQLEGSNLTLHHSPPPSSPSYTNGAVPPFLRWVNGESVQLTGEEGAPKRVERRGPGFKPAWDGQVKMQMKEMRARGMSRLEIAKTLSIPPTQTQHISRVAPQSTEQRAATDARLVQAKETWGYKKTVSRAIREKRKTLW